MMEITSIRPERSRPRYRPHGLRGRAAGERLGRLLRMPPVRTPCPVAATV